MEERPCTMDDLRAASEAFLASTTREVQSIAAVDDIELPEGERTREARRALRARIEEELGELARGARARLHLMGHVPGHVPDHAAARPTPLREASDQHATM